MSKNKINTRHQSYSNIYILLIISQIIAKKKVNSNKYRRYFKHKTKGY